MGFALGLVVFLIPFLLGAMGAADVKVFAVTGLYLGPFDILNAFVYSLLSGGVLALFYWLYAMVNGHRIAGWRLFHFNKNESVVNCCQFRSNTKESFSIVNHCSNMG
jgi:Flp pilus assembly protein protease CpaA